MQAVPSDSTRFLPQVQYLKQSNITDFSEKLRRSSESQHYLTRTQPATTSA
jgi:hypothetical protein